MDDGSYDGTADFQASLELSVPGLRVVRGLVVSLRNMHPSHQQRAEPCPRRTPRGLVVVVLWGAVGAIALAARLLLPIDETRYL